MTPIGIVTSIAAGFRGRNARRICSCLAAGMAVMALTSCGGSPVSPTPTVTGLWLGSLNETQAGGCAHAHALHLNLTQSGSNVSGSWVADGGNCESDGGAVSGSVTGADLQMLFVGSAAQRPGRLTVTGSFSGNAMSGTYHGAEGETGNWSVAR